MAITAAENDLFPDLLKPADLVRLPVILYEAGGNTRRIVDKWIAQDGIAIKPMMELGSIEAIKELVGAGLGCAIIPGSAIRRKGESQLLKHCPLSPRLYRRLALVIRRDKPLRKGLRETRQALHQHLSDLSVP